MVLQVLVQDSPVPECSGYSCAEDCTDPEFQALESTDYYCVHLDDLVPCAVDLGAAVQVASRSVHAHLDDLGPGAVAVESRPEDVHLDDSVVEKSAREDHHAAEEIPVRADRCAAGEMKVHADHRADPENAEAGLESAANSGSRHVDHAETARVDVVGCDQTTETMGASGAGRNDTDKRTVALATDNKIRLCTMRLQYILV